MDDVERAWAAVVVNFNAGDHLAECVRSLCAEHSAGVPEIVVVDNGSDDGSLERIAGDASVRVVHAPGNVGYARAANLGIAATRAETVAVLNPDVVVGAGTGAVMVAAFARDPVVGAVGPLLLDAHGARYPSARALPDLPTAIGHAVLGWPWPQNRWTRRYHNADLDPDRRRPADWLSGAAIWLRRSALDDVGGWDERFFLFMEEVDLCVRLRARGWRVVYEPAATVVHVEGVSRRRHPVRTTIEHHRAAYRFACIHWRGARRALLPLAALALAARAALLISTAPLRRRGSRRPPRTRRAARIH